MAYIYVIALKDLSAHDSLSCSTGNEDWPVLYVGFTNKPVNERYDQHLNGIRSSRRIRISKFDPELRLDFTELFDPEMTQIEARAAEMFLTDFLIGAGFTVLGEDEQLLSTLISCPTQYFDQIMLIDHEAANWQERQRLKTAKGKIHWGGGTILMAEEDEDELVNMVNSMKKAVTNNAGGGFRINKYGQVICVSQAPAGVNSSKIHYVALKSDKVITFEKPIRLGHRSLSEATSRNESDVRLTLEHRIKSEVLQPNEELLEFFNYQTQGEINECIEALLKDFEVSHNSKEDYG